MTPPEPRANPELIGHEHAARALEEAARSGRLAHAWALAGPPGIGKATLAWRFARWLLAGPPAGEPAAAGPLHLPPSHPIFRRVAAGAHADAFTLAPSTGGGAKRIHRAEDARAARRFLSFTAAEGGWRVLVIEDLDQADRDIVQNILLKTLEEPPPRTVQLITTAAPDRLLPTIRSRVRRLDLFPLPPAEMARLLDRWLPDQPPAERAALVGIADGAPGRALLLSEGEGLALQTLVEEVLAGLPRLDPRRAQDIADRIAARRDPVALATFMALLRRALAAGLRAAARGAPAPAWAAGRSLADWSTLWDKLGRLAEETDRLNLDRKQAVLSGLGLLTLR